MVEAGSKNEESSNTNYWPMLLDYSESYCRKVLRSLELKAYSMVITALRAQGPLTESKQSALKELRKLLSITIERHKAEVRRAVNDEELATICDWICGYSVDEDWVLEGRRVVDVRSRSVPNTLYTERANHISERHAKANDHLPSPAQTGNLERTFMPPAATQPKLTARKQSHPRSAASSNSTPPVSSIPVQSSNQVPIVSKPTAGTVVLNESSSTQSNISQLEYSMMISENTTANRSSYESGVVIETLAADIPQGDLIVDSFAEPVPTSSNVKQSQSVLPVSDAWASESNRTATLQGQNIVLLGRPQFGQERDSEQVIKVSAQSIQHLNPQITEVKSLHGIVQQQQQQQQQLRPQISTTRLLNASRVRPIVASIRSESPAQLPSQPDRAKFTVNAAATTVRKTGQGNFIVVPTGAGKTVVTSGSFQPVKIFSSSPIYGGTSVDKPVTSRSFSAPVLSKHQPNIQKTVPPSVPVDLDSDEITTNQSSISSNIKEIATIKSAQSGIVPQSVSSVNSLSLSYSVPSGPQYVVPKLTLSQLPQDTSETFNVADKRVRPVEPPSNWIQMALGFLNRYCISWSEQSEVAVLANDFTKVKHNLIASVYPSIREMDADVRNIRLRSLGGARDNLLLIKKIEDIFNSYDQDYRNLVERLDKTSGQQPKRPRFN